MSLKRKFVNSTLVNKVCNKCGESYPRDDQHFYSYLKDGRLRYENRCIACAMKSNEIWREKNKNTKSQRRLKYVETDQGFFNEMFNAMRKSKNYVESEFPDQKSFMDHWYQQKEKLGMTCPATGVEMTMIKGKRKACPTNISKDRLVPSLGYTKQNTIFVAWKFNNDKKAITPKNAISYLKLVQERFNTTDIE